MTLTPRQSAIFDYIRSCDVPPTVREIAAQFGIGSPNGVMCHIKSLERKGMITRDGRTARCIRVSGEPSVRELRKLLTAKNLDGQEIEIGDRTYRLQLIK